MLSVYTNRSFIVSTITNQPSILHVYMNNKHDHDCAKAFSYRTYPAADNVNIVALVFFQVFQVNSDFECGVYGVWTDIAVRLKLLAELVQIICA